MTNLDVVYTTSSDQAPVTGDRSGLAQAFRGRLAQALDRAQELYVDAEYLHIEMADLWAGLKKIAGSDVLDSATWLHNATMNTMDELDVLIDRLVDAIDRTPTPTR